MQSTVRRLEGLRLAASLRKGRSSNMDCCGMASTLPTVSVADRA